MLTPPAMSTLPTRKMRNLSPTRIALMISSLSITTEAEKPKQHGCLRFFITIIDSNKLQAALSIDPKTDIQMSFTTLLRSFLHLNGSTTVLIASIAAGVPAKLGLWDAGNVVFVVAATVVSYVAVSVVLPFLARCIHSRRQPRDANGFYSRWSMMSTAVKFGGHLATLRFVERYIDDPTDAMNTLSILETMSCTDEHILKIIAEMGGIETAVKSLKKFSEESEGVARYGCGLLRNVCGYNALNDQKILECGGITALVQAMTH